MCDLLHRYNIFKGTIYDPETEISFILLSDRDIKCAIACRYDAKCVWKGDIFGARCTLWSTARCASYTNVSPSFSVDLTHLFVTICPRATNAFISALPQHRARWTRHGERDRRRVLATGARFYKGRYCGLPWRSFRPPLNIVYWLPPPISQTLVTRSCPSPTANKPRAVIWHWLSYPASLPAGISLWRTVRCPRHHVHSAQVKRACSISVLASEFFAIIKRRARYYFIEREREKILTDLIYNTIGYKDNYYSPSLCRSFKGFGNCISVKISQIQQ